MGNEQAQDGKGFVLRYRAGAPGDITSFRTDDFEVVGTYDSGEVHWWADEVEGQVIVATVDAADDEVLAGWPVPYGGSVAWGRLRVDRLSNVDDEAVNRFSKMRAVVMNGTVPFDGTCYCGYPVRTCAQRRCDLR